MAERAEPPTLAELAELPVFPLPRAVLFPGTTLGLHLFEPRYRALMRHCLEHGPMLMAIAHLVPGHDGEHEGQPPIHDVAGVGRIVAHRANADGTFDVALAGVARVRLHELPFVAPFRRARAEVLADVVARPDVLQRLAELIVPTGSSAAMATNADPGELVDIVIDRAVSDPLARQQLLETLDVEQRLDEVMRVLFTQSSAAKRWEKAN